MAGETEDRARVVAIAQSWIGTPFHDLAGIKGKNGGVDCAQLLRCVYTEAGLIEPFSTGYYSRDHYLHSGEQKFLGFVQRYAHEIPQEKVGLGDIVLYWVGLAYGHGAIVIDRWAPQVQNIIHAHYSRGVVRGFGQAPRLGRKVERIAFFSRWGA